MRPHERGRLNQTSRTQENLRSSALDVKPCPERAWKEDRGGQAVAPRMKTEEAGPGQLTKPRTNGVEYDRETW